MIPQICWLIYVVSRWQIVTKVPTQSCFPVSNLLCRPLPHWCLLWSCDLLWPMGHGATGYKQEIKKCVTTGLALLLPLRVPCKEARASLLEEKHQRREPQPPRSISSQPIYKLTVTTPVTLDKISMSSFMLDEFSAN